MSETLLFERLDQLVEDCSGSSGNWDDVLRRAVIAGESSALRPLRRLARRRVLVPVAAAIALLVILLATPALGLLREWIGRKDVPFSESKEAPFRVQRDFYDLSIGAPPNMGSQTIALQTRKVAVFNVFGSRHVLYVAPTRSGGFCSSLGGCVERKDYRAQTYPRRPGSINPHLLSFGIGMWRVTRPPSNGYALQIDGIVLARNADTLTAEFEDGSTESVPFVYVSKPIDAGFFVYGISGGHHKVGSRLEAVSARDSEGKLIAREILPEAIRSPLATQARLEARARKLLERPTPPQPPLPTPKLPKPKPPLQRGLASGVSVIAGSNGAAVFDFSGASGEVRSVLEKGGTTSCLKFTSPYHEEEPTGIGASFREGEGPLVGQGQTRVPTPFDGCEMGGMYGRMWPDRFDAHEAVEIAFTKRAKRYFAERAAARDLALFVRLLRIRGIRGLEGEALATELSRRFGDAIERLPSGSRRLPAGRIGYVTVGSTGGGATFTEFSTTGRRFFITVENGGIADENVRPLTILN